MPTGEPDVHIPCDDVLIAVGQENAFPWIETDLGIAFNRGGMPAVDPVTFQSSLPHVFFGGDAAFGPKNIITAVAHGHEAAISIDAYCRGADPRVRPPPTTNLVSQKMGIHDWSYDSAITLDRRFAVPQVERAAALRNLRTEVELGFTDAAGARRSAPLPQLRRPDRLLGARLHRVRRLRRRLSDRLHLLRAERARRRIAPVAQRAGDQSRSGHSRVRAGQEPAQSWSRTRTSVSTAACAPSAVRPARGTCRNLLIEMAASGAGMPIEAVNDFVIRFANVNGSGSASANLLFARSILRMGVPIAPRNIFPSNIQGLPTWYEVRVSEDGWLGARGGADMLVAMNAQTFAQDVAALDPGGYLFYDSTRPLPPSIASRRHRGARHAAHRNLRRAISESRGSASSTATSSMSARSPRCSTSTSASWRRWPPNGSRARTS